MYRSACRRTTALLGCARALRKGGSLLASGVTGVDGEFARWTLRPRLQTIEGVGDDKLKVYLYHIPPVAQVGISVDLIARLRR